MKSLSSPELAVLVEEWQNLLGARINKIFQHDDKHISLQLNAKGKVFLHVLPGIVTLSPLRLPSLPKPKTFVTQLRQYIENGKITAISQGNFDRVLILDIEKTSHFQLIFELFGHSNAILTDQDSIISVQEKRDWKTRSLRPGKRYAPPPSPVDTPSLSYDQFRHLLSESSMDTLVKFLAAELGLGKAYAEELCLRAKIAKDRKILALTESDDKSLYTSLQVILKERNPVVIKLSERPVNALPFKTSGSPASSFSDALAEVFAELISDTHDEEADALQQILSQQEQMMSSLLQEIDEAAKQGEAVYENYTLLEEILAIIQQHKTKGWPWVKEQLKRFKQFDYVDEGKGELALNLQ